MPHDKNGRLIEVDDKVNVEFRVVGVYQGEEYCNISLQTVESMYPSNNKTYLTLNSKQTVKIVETADHSSKFQDSR